jgi:Mor family transcriptional regulator
MEQQPWIDDITADMLPEPYRKLCGIIGIANIISLAELFQGTTVYFPKLDGIIKMIRNSKIREEFDGGNVTELAIKYNLTEVWVRQILQDMIPDDNQGTLF